jgi:GTPase Era involved in 16S rRNA processing
LIDTPGASKASNSMRSKLLVSKAWENLSDVDMAMFVVDSVRKLDFEVKETILRLNKLRFDPETRKVVDAIKDDSYSDERLAKGFYEMTEQEKELSSW